jgi:hypothetical protein
MKILLSKTKLVNFIVVDINIHTGDVFITDTYSDRKKHLCTC